MLDDTQVEAPANGPLGADGTGSDCQCRAWVERMYTEHASALRAVLYHRTRCRAKAEDLAQEVWARLAQMSVEKVAAIREPVAYMYTIAANLVCEDATRERHMRGSISAEDSAIQHELAEQTSAEGRVELQRRVELLKDVLSELTPKCRAAMVMRFWHHLSYAQIAQQLDISLNMVKKYLKQGIRHCRSRMGRLR